MRRLLALGCLAAVLVLAGCSAPTAGDARPDPVVDRQGWENGYWYDDSLDVTAEDGLNESEREAVVARQMARIEHIRGKEFRDTTELEVISRAEYRERYGPSGGGGNNGDPWTDQTWKALFLVGDDQSSEDAVGEALSASVQGFYDPREERIVIVSDETPPAVDRSVLVHELVHALQDQQLDLGNRPPQLDAGLAESGVVEGDANYVQARYEDRCGAEWDCIDRPSRTSSGGGGGASFDRGVFLVLFTPYAAGPGFVADVRDRGGWAAVDRLYSHYPDSTAQVIHPERYPADRPAEVTVPDRSTTAWERFDRTPEANTVGEAAIYAMFWANGRVDREGTAVYSYDHPLSDGWTGDTLVPYRDGDRTGYVWTTRWERPEDAREFAATYRGIVAERADREPAAGTYVVPEDDEFAGAYRVRRDGREVTVVHGPSTSALSDIHGTAASADG